MSKDYADDGDDCQDVDVDDDEEIDPSIPARMIGRISAHAEARAHNEWGVKHGYAPLPLCDEVDCECWRRSEVPEETDDEDEYWDPEQGPSQAEIRAYIAEHVAKANTVG